MGPLLQCLNPALERGETQTRQKTESDEVIDIVKGHVASTAEELAVALQRLSSLLLSTSYAAICRRVLEAVTLPLWILSSWTEPDLEMETRYCSPARALLTTYLKIASADKAISRIIPQLVARSIAKDATQAWEFQSSLAGCIQISQTDSPQSTLEIAMATQKAESLVKMIQTSCTVDEAFLVFSDLFGTWLDSTRKPTTHTLRFEDDKSSFEDSIQGLCQMAVLQQMMDQLPGHLISRSTQLLDILCKVLDSSDFASTAEEIITVSMSLLNLVITSAGFRTTTIPKEQLQIIQRALEKLQQDSRGELASTATNLGLLLKYRDELDENQDAGPSLSEKQIEDKKSFDLAISYITETDSPAPVKAQGLDLLTKLVKSASSVLDIPAILVLLSSIIKNNDDFVNLRSIQTYAHFSVQHPKSVTAELVDRYVDAKEVLTTEVRLRFGEALLGVIQRLGETFTGEFAKDTCTALLSIASRRGVRPKTELKQAREARMKAMREKKGKQAAEDQVDDWVDKSEEDRHRDDVFSQIVQGWESKRGSEDIRMRSSALSLLSAIIEANIAGLDASIVSHAVDLCVSVLTLEPEMEKAILRRAAIILVLNFVKGLDAARQDNRQLAFGLTDTSRAELMRVLGYISATDNDGLVRQHAEDMIESLESWELMRFLPPEGDSLSSSTRNLEGLYVDPLRQLSGGGGANVSGRPRIEEIE